MKKSIVNKIIFSIIFIFIISFSLQLFFQNFILEELYELIKIKKFEKNFDDFLMNEETINEDKIVSFQENNNASLLVLDSNNNILNEDFFEEFNYLSISKNSRNFNVIIDFIVDEAGEIVINKKELLIDKEIIVKGFKIKGTSYIIPITLKTENLFLENDLGIELYESGYKDKILEFRGKIDSKNLINRFKGIYSFQNRKLWIEFQFLLMEFDRFSEFFSKNQGYSFIEEESGLEIIVIGGESSNNKFISLITIQNLSGTFKIFNEYYFYFFIFQLFLIIILAIIYSKWLTKPLLRLNNQAKKIATKDFSLTVDIKSSDEIGELSKSLNNISKELSASLIELELKEKRVRGLLRDLSHEFKTPLGIISGFLEIIEDELYEENPKYYFNSIDEEINHLNYLVKETLNLLTIESEKLILNLEEINLKELIEKTIDKFQYDINRKNLKVKMQMNDIFINADYVRMEQVFKNLLKNSIEYTPQGNEIIVGCIMEKNKKYIFIRNFGVNINEDEINKIWDRYYRIENSRSNNSFGTGLGLSIVKSILDKHGFNYGLKNIYNGVEFYFYISQGS